MRLSNFLTTSGNVRIAADQAVCEIVLLKKYLFVIMQGYNESVKLEAQSYNKSSLIEVHKVISNSCQL